MATARETARILSHTANTKAVFRLPVAFAQEENLSLGGQDVYFHYNNVWLAYRVYNPMGIRIYWVLYLQEIDEYEYV